LTGNENANNNVLDKTILPLSVEKGLEVRSKSTQ